MSCCPSALISCHPSHRCLSTRRCSSLLVASCHTTACRPASLPLLKQGRSVTQISQREVYSAFGHAGLHLQLVRSAAKHPVSRQELFRRLLACLHFLYWSEVLFELGLPLPAWRRHILPSWDAPVVGRRGCKRQSNLVQ